MRKDNPAIVDGLFEMLIPEHDKIVMYLRKCTRQTLLVVANFSGDALELPLPEQVTGHRWEKLLSNYKDTDCLAAKALRPWEAAIYELTE